MPTSDVEPTVTVDAGLELSIVPWEPSKNQVGFILKQQSALRFDFKNRLAKVSWILTNSAKGIWTLYIDNKEVTESTKNSWVAAMEEIRNGTNKFQE